MNIKHITAIILIIGSLMLQGCSSLPMSKSGDACEIFAYDNSWYWAAQKAEKKWGVPIAVMLAIIYQESSFKASAKPPRTKILWIIPWKRPTSAYGYCQAVDSTWALYEKENNRQLAFRNSFADSVDFIGWYAHTAYIKLGIKKNNAAHLYLAYHEGFGGYKKKLYQQKKWLMNTALKVQKRAAVYARQLKVCRKNLPDKPWYRF